MLRDLTIGCIKGNHTGAHIFGPPGVSKSYTIQQTLREFKASWQVHQRITAKPLYLELEKHPGAIHLIEDCEQLFNEKSALTLLRSALGGERVNGRRERRVSYSIAGSHARVLEHYFFGAVIFTSNRPLSDEKPEIRAVMSRIPCIGHSPPESEIRALMRHVARQGHVSETGRMSPAACVEVIEHIIETAAALKCRLDLRWIDHAYGHYLTQATGGGGVDWRDMTKFHMLNTLTYFDHSPPVKSGASSTPGRQQDDMARQIALARELADTQGLSQEERLQRWEQNTGLSRPTYYRRLASGTEQ